MAKSSTILVATLATAVAFMVFVISQVDLSIYNQSMHNSYAVGDAPWEVLNNSTKTDENGEDRSNNKMNVIQTGQQHRIITNDNNNDIHLERSIPETSNNNFDHNQSQATTKSVKNSKIKSKTKIVAITDSQYSQIALSWHRKLTSLGYTTHTIAAADDDSLTFLRSQTNISVEPLLHPQSSGWPVARGKPQELRRRIFATRWVYILGQLKLGNHVLLTDADNIFVRYMPLEVMEDSEYDVYHAHCGDFPIRFLSMGFVVCGGMAWLRSSEGTVRYVESILEQCGWGGMDDDAKDGDLGAGDGMMIKAKAARCDDQQVVNSKFFFNSLNYTWDDEETRPKLEQGFWKGESSGRSLVTGHRFKLWSVDMCYRGPVNGTFGRCPDPNVNWVAMPTNTITSEKQLDKVRDRKLRVEQWFRFCRNGTSIGDGGFHS